LWPLDPAQPLAYIDSHKVELSPDGGSSSGGGGSVSSSSGSSSSSSGSSDSGGSTARLLAITQARTARLQLQQAQLQLRVSQLEEEGLDAAAAAIAAGTVPALEALKTLHRQVDEEPDSPTASQASEGEGISLQEVMAQKLWKFLAENSFIQGQFSREFYPGTTSPAAFGLADVPFAPCSLADWLPSPYPAAAQIASWRPLSGRRPCLVSSTLWGQ
jgi:hypothetical protein